jgi:hypothetical protein
MDTYTIKSIANGKVVIDFSCKGSKVTETFDARYIPLHSKQELDEYCTTWMSSWSPSVQPEVSPEIAALINKAQSVE